jgi:hypothetical protein
MRRAAGSSKLKILQMKLQFKTLLLSACVLANVVSALAGVSVLDYRTPSYVQFELPTLSVGDDRTNLVVTIYRTGEFRQQTSLDYQTEEGTAEEGVNFQATGGTLTFPAGQSYKTISIPLTATSVGASNRTFTVKLSNPAVNCEVVGSTCQVTITNAAPIVAKLSVRKEGTGIVLSWNGVQNEQILERRAGLVGSSWEAVPDGAEWKGDHYEYVEPVTGVQYFYRLKTVQTGSF